MDNIWSLDQAENDVLTKLIKIVNINPIKSKNNNKNELGRTIEEMFGIDNNQLPVADYNGIEIKCKYIKSEYPIRLFSCNLDGANLFEVKNIFEKFSNISNGKRKFNHSFFNTKISYINNNTISKLIVNSVEKKIYMKFYNRKYETIYDNAYWSYDLLEERTKIKLNYIVMIKYEIKYINNEKYYIIKNIIFYKYKGFERFIELIKYGIIFVNSSISSTIDSNNKEKIINHGLNFVIDYKNFDLLYDKIKTINL